MNMSRIRAILFLSLAFSLCHPAFAITYSVFTTTPAPGSTQPTPGSVGWTYAGNKFVGTIDGNGTGLLYSTDLSGGNVQLFAPTVNLSQSTPSTEHYIAASPNIGTGLNTWTGGELYVANGRDVVHISNNGASSNNFVTNLGVAGDEVRGIGFDIGGAYGNTMIATMSSGAVYKITANGSATPLANVGVQVEGIDFAPGGFGPYGGQLFVASESANAVYAISTSGTVTQLNNGSSGGPININSAEQLTFVPTNLGGSLYPALEGLYSANYTPNVLFANAAQFASDLGDMIVTGETTDQVTRVHWDAGLNQYTLIPEGFFPGGPNAGASPQPEDGVFITPDLLAALPPVFVPEPSSVILGLIGAAGMGFIAVRRRGSRK
jgi:hypothetical protein